MACIDDFTKSATLAFKAADEAILLIGETKGWLGQSLYLREICEREDGAPPPVDLAAERAATAISSARSLPKVSPRRSMMSPTAASWSLLPRWRWRQASALSSIAHRSPRTPFWFGEDQGRYVVTVDAGVAEKVMMRARAAGISARQIGLTGGDALTLQDERPILVAKLRERFEGWLPRYMAGGPA